MVKVGDYELPDDLYYTDKHTWAKVEGDNVRVGVDAIGVALAGKIIFVRVKKVGKEVKAGKNFGTGEAGKGVIPLVVPVTGEIVETNPKAGGREVKAVNEDPYGEGWLAVIKPTGDKDSELGALKHGDNVVAWAEEEIKQI
ncbi:MAG: glycine cleavage system protein H [Candidatus Helarchaeota archaeon]